MREKIERIVWDILLNNEQARNDDHVLYAEYVKLEDKILAEEFREIMRKIRERKFADRKSVERARRKLQAWDREKETYLIQSDYFIQKLRKEREGRERAYGRQQVYM